MLPAMYLGTIILSSIIATGASLIGSFIVFRFIFPTDLWWLYTLAIVGSAIGFSVGSFPLITYNKISAKRVGIDSTLPFVLAYLATLSSAGMNPVESIKHVALKNFGPVSREFQKVVYREEILGEDIITALNFVATNTPSDPFRDILIGVTNIIVSGGSLRSYCEQQSKILFDQKRAKLKGFIDSLATFSEGYIGGVVISIVMGIIGIIIVGALGFKILFFTTQNLLDIFVFVVVPLVNAIFLAMLEMRFSSGEF